MSTSLPTKPGQIRERVEEHRITIKTEKGFCIRFWIETDPLFGGIPEWDDAYKLCLNATKYAMASRFGSNKYTMNVTKKRCRFLLIEIPAANSVEVCDESGNGITMHRDWP